MKADRFSHYPPEQQQRMNEIFQTYQMRWIAYEDPDLEEQLKDLSPEEAAEVRKCCEEWTDEEEAKETLTFDEEEEAKINDAIEAFQIALNTGSNLNLEEPLAGCSAEVLNEPIRALSESPDFEDQLKDLSSAAACEVREYCRALEDLRNIEGTTAPSEWLKRFLKVILGIVGGIAACLVGARKGFSQAADGLREFASRLPEMLHTFLTGSVGLKLVYMAVGIFTAILAVRILTASYYLIKKSDSEPKVVSIQESPEKAKPPQESKSTGNLSTATPLAQGEEPPQTQVKEMSPNPGEERSRLSAEATPPLVIASGLIQPQPIVPKRSDYIAPVSSALPIERPRLSISNLKEYQERTKIPGSARANKGFSTEVLTFKKPVDTSQLITIGEIVGKVVQEQHFLWAYLQEDLVTGEFIGARLDWDSYIEISPKKCVTLSVTFSTGAIRSKALTQNLRS